VQRFSIGREWRGKEGIGRDRKGMDGKAVVLIRRGENG
jgi:hypothetical protein